MNRPNPNRQTEGGILYRRLVGALLFSLNGLKRAMQEEACQVQAVIIVPLTVLGFWLGNDATEKLLLVVPLLGVFVVELLNTAIEVTVNRISTERHQLSKEAKDLGSAAVLIAMLIAGLCWLVILLPRV